MSLKRILQIKKASTDEPLDVVKIIDEQCLSRGVFDFDAIREALRKLTKYAERENINSDEFMKLFFQLNQMVYADLPRSKGKFHPSSLMDDCERRMYYEITGVPESDTISNKIDGRLQRIFDVGTWWHTYIQSCLWRAGILELSEAPVVNRKRKINGRADGVLRLSKRTLLEIKTMNSFIYAKGKLKPFKKHESQAGVYAKELGIEQICFLYINKDTSEMVAHIVPVNKPLIKEAYDKMDGILDAVDEGYPPVREHCTSQNSAMAKACPYKTKCFNPSRRK